MTDSSFSRRKKDKVFLHLKSQLAEKEEARTTSKRDPLEEEIYIDKHRQAAVTLGQRDVAADVKAKKRREKRTGKIAEDEVDGLEYLIYLSQGIFEMKCGSVERALVYLNKSIELEPPDEIAFIVRSECFNRLERGEEAIGDALKALEMNPNSSKAIIAHGDALYSMGEFEKGLVRFQKGWKTRMDPKMRNGIQKCKIAIENAVGKNSKPFDIDLVEKVIKENEKDKVAKPDRAAIDAAKLEESSKSKSRRKLERLRREDKRKKIDRLFLGKVAEDASFLRQLAGVDIEKHGAETEFEQTIMMVAAETLAYLEKRKIFWQQTAM